jgi:hypothetical protein
MGAVLIRAMALVVLIGATLLSSGCSRAFRVKPHQREYLADRIMRIDAEGQERAAQNHVLVSREGAIGGMGTVGGGCGCN